MFALVDCNSFYCSCERVFAPKLWNQPVIVLSNNDGCAVARTAEAKALGIRMGDPFFKIRDIVKKHGVHVFSSNYALYADMSARVVDTLQGFSSNMEIYSIDESFLDVSGFGDRNLIEYGQDIRQTVRAWTGIPVCVGIGPTKTIAKLANWLAKSRAEYDGVCDLSNDRSAVYGTIPVGEVWGIGRASVAKLERLGIRTVAELRDIDLRKSREALTVVGARIVMELRGTSCLPLEFLAPQRKGMAVTRSFGQPVTRWTEMSEAVATYATRTGEKLRLHGLVAGAMLVFAHTSRFSTGPSYSNAATSQIEETSDTRHLVANALACAKRIWRDGYRYSKAGIVLSDLSPAARRPADLFPTHDRQRSVKLMSALDKVNQRFGRNTLYPAAAGIKRAWSLRADRKSPCYTTRVDELPIARA